MATNEPTPTTTIRVEISFKTHLEAHGKYGERHQDILTRLMGDNWKIPTGDREKKVYDKSDVNSRSTNKKRGEKCKKYYKPSSLTDSGGKRKWKNLIIG